MERGGGKELILAATCGKWGNGQETLAIYQR